MNDHTFLEALARKFGYNYEYAIWRNEHSACALIFTDITNRDIVLYMQFTDGYNTYLTKLYSYKVKDVDPGNIKTTDDDKDIVELDRYAIKLANTIMDICSVDSTFLTNLS